MASDKLGIYNEAAGHLEERRLGALTDQTKLRKGFDQFYDQAKAYCLERKYWNFCYRTMQVDASPSIIPQFGYSYAFPIPPDWVRTRAISAVETLSPPLLQYREESGFWYANLTPLYVQFNSSDVAYGNDLSLWPPSFADYVALRLARQACKTITGSRELLEGPQGLIKQEEKAAKVAASICAMNDPVQFAPRSSWVSARRGLFPRGDDPTGGSLIP